MLVDFCEDVKVDLTFIIDESGSVGPRRFVIEKEFAKNISSVLNISENTTRIGCITFSTKPTLQFSFTADSDEVMNYFDNVPYGKGVTRTGKALNMAVNMIEQYGRSSARQVVILLTDGKATDPVNLARVAIDYHTHGYMTFAVGVGKATLEDLGVI